MGTKTKNSKHVHSGEVLYDGQNRLDTTNTLSEFLSVPRIQIYWAAESKGMPHYHAGRYMRFAREEVLRWLRDSYPHCVRYFEGADNSRLDRLAQGDENA